MGGVVRVTINMGTANNKDTVSPMVAKVIMVNSKVSIKVTINNLNTMVRNKGTHNKVNTTINNNTAIKVNKSMSELSALMGMVTEADTYHNNHNNDRPHQTPNQRPKASQKYKPNPTVV